MKKLRDLPRQASVDIFSDERGKFFPLNLKGKNKTADGAEYDWAWTQSNLSTSKRGVLRGLHHQKGNYAQAKLLTVIEGQIIDFVIDLNKASFGKTFLFHLGEGQSANQIFVPTGYLHGFVVISETATVQYLIDTPYAPSSELCVKWDTIPAVKDIVCRNFEEKDLILSPRDLAGLPFSRELEENYL